MDSQPLREPSAAFSDRPDLDLPQRSYINRSFTATQRPYVRRLRRSTGTTQATQQNEPHDAAEDESVWHSDSDILAQPSQLTQRPAFAIISNVALKAEPAVGLQHRCCLAITSCATPHRQQESRARRKASQLCLSAEKLLHNLTQPIKGWSDLLPVMPKSAIKYSNAIVVLMSKKAGCGLSYGFGYGFCVVKLAQHGCLAKWSAPLFFRTQFFSVGATIGYLRTGLVRGGAQAAALMRDITAPPGGLVYLDKAWVMEYSDSAQQYRSRGTGHVGARLNAGVDGDSKGSYYVKSGAIVDLSLRVGVRWVEDDYLNTALYGAATPAGDVLSGAIAPLPEFMSLYQLLNSLAMESSI